jgi:hypothetical protein
MANERLRTAMAKAGVGIPALARATGVDPKTVERWMGGRVPHSRNRIAVAALVHEDETYLWPVAPGRDPAAKVGSTAEVKAAYPHRAEVPTEVWRRLLVGARARIDLLGYAMLFFPEQHPKLVELLREKCARGCQIRIALADPDAPHTMERDALEQLGGTLPDRIRTTMHHFEEARAVAGCELRMHRAHLYNAIYRFDDDMIVTPYLVGAHGFQHPALQLRRLGPFGLFEQFTAQFERIWTDADGVEAERAAHSVGERESV